LSNWIFHPRASHTLSQKLVGTPTIKLNADTEVIGLDWDAHMPGSAGEWVFDAFPLGLDRCISTHHATET
jgi:hypothetical protein